MRDSFNVDVVILPSLYFQMCHYAICIQIIIIICVVILYSSDSCAPEFMSKRFSLSTRLRSDAPKDFITPVTHHAALPMQP